MKSWPALAKAELLLRLRWRFATLVSLAKGFVQAAISIWAELIVRADAAKFSGWGAVLWAPV